MSGIQDNFLLIFTLRYLISSVYLIYSSSNLMTRNWMAFFPRLMIVYLLLSILNFNLNFIAH